MIYTKVSPLVQTEESFPSRFDFFLNNSHVNSEIFLTVYLTSILTRGNVSLLHFRISFAEWRCTFLSLKILLASFHAHLQVLHLLSRETHRTLGCVSAYNTEARTGWCFLLMIDHLKFLLYVRNIVRKLNEVVFIDVFVEIYRFLLGASICNFIFHSNFTSHTSLSDS